MTNEFLGILKRTMGIHAVVLVGYEKNAGIATSMYVFLLSYAITLTRITCSFENDPPESQSKPFSMHSNEAKNWARGGADFLAKYLMHRGTLYSVQIISTYTTQTESDESGDSSEEEDEIIPEVPHQEIGEEKIMHYNHRMQWIMVYMTRY